jgi:hypothetical protein
MKRTPHPPYSPDLALCDLYVFGYIKGRLASASFKEPDQPLQAVNAISSPFKSHIGTRVSGVDGQINAMLCGSWWFSRRYIKKSEDDPRFTRPVLRC